MPIPQIPMLILAQPPRPTASPARNGLFLITIMPATANTTDSASLWAPAITAQISTGFAIVISAARAWRCGSALRAMNSTPRQHRTNGTAEKSCNQKTTSCMLVPPSLLAATCVQEVIGP